MTFINSGGFSFDFGRARKSPASLAIIVLLSSAILSIASTAPAADQPKLPDQPKQTTTAENAPLIPRDVLFGNPDKAMARMSHDGKRLAYLAPVKTENGDVLNVFVGPLDNPSAAKPVTHEKDRPIEEYFWAYDNKHILYMMDDKGDENFHVYAVNLDTGKTADITPLDPKNATDEKGNKKKVRRNRRRQLALARGNYRRPQRPRPALSRSVPREYQHRRA